MDFGKAFSFVFDDQDWLKKVGIGALIMIIPLIGQIIVVGWGVEITKRVIRRDPEPLPNWDDFGGYLMKGLQVVVIGLVYALPMILLVACPSIILGVASDSGGDTIAAIASIVTVCISCFAFLYGIALGLVAPAAIGAFATTDQLGAAFKFGEVIGLVRAAPGPYFLVLLGTILSGFIGSLGAIACGIGMLFTLTYANAINAHLYGQAYNEAIVAKGSQAEMAAY